MATVGLRNLVVLAQVRVEGALAVGRSVVGAKATRRIADVRITATTIVHIHNGLRVNVRQVVRRALLQELERAYGHENRGSADPQRQYVKQGEEASEI